MMSIWATHDIWQAKINGCRLYRETILIVTQLQEQDTTPTTKARHRMSLCNRLGNHLDHLGIFWKVLVLVRH